MKKTLLLLFFLPAFLTLTAQEYMLYDFEDCEVGDVFPIKTIFGWSTVDSAVVELDPVNPANKVLHVVSKNWNQYVEYALPEGFTAADFCNYPILSCDLRLDPSMSNRWIQSALYLGTDEIYRDPSYPEQGYPGSWYTNHYAFSGSDNGAATFLLGFQSDEANYYVDNIRLSHPDFGYDYTDETQTLRYWAEKNGKRIGAAVPVWRVDLSNDNSDMSRTIYSNFDMLVAENEMKVDALQPNEGEFTFWSGDQLVEFAERHGMGVRGHTLCWHKQLPKWITESTSANSHRYSRERLLSILENHITTVMTHYKGRVAEWDVVNECLDDTQNTMHKPESTGREYDLRKSVWSSGIGVDFIDSAFVYAHRADPDAKLFLNEYGVENSNWKTNAYYYLAEHLVNSGIPIHGVGLQCHFDAGKVLKDSAQLANNIKRFEALGLEVVVTELDIAASDKQADEFRIVSNICMEQPNCHEMMIWGISDKDSWRSGAYPLLFDAELRAKPAFFAVRDALEEQAERLAASVEAVPTDKRPASTCVDVYNMLGQKVATGMHRDRLKELPAGFYIVDGEKIIVQ